jgi:hypothetical protein
MFSPWRNGEEIPHLSFVLGTLSKMAPVLICALEARKLNSEVATRKLELLDLEVLKLDSVSQ